MQRREVAVDYVTMELTNQRQKVSLSLLKKDAETGKPLEGVMEKEKGYKFDYEEGNMEGDSGPVWKKDSKACTWNSESTRVYSFCENDNRCSDGTV